MKPWRIPTSIECQLLFFHEAFGRNEEEANRQLVNQYFKDTDLCFWTATFNPVFPNEGLAMLFSYGLMDFYKKTHLLNARLVRGPLIKRYSELHFCKKRSDRFKLSHCNRIVLDTVTGLEWRVFAEAELYSWHEAQRCFAQVP